MKKFISLILSLTMIAGLCAAFTVSAAEEAKAPKITVDGKLDDWTGTHTLSVVGSGEFDGKKVTFYGTVTDEGIYLAADAYHDNYVDNDGTWWQNTDFEMYVNRIGNGSGHMWVAPQGPGGDGLSQEDVAKINAKMKTDEINGDTKYHTVIEVLLPVTLDAVAKNIANGTARVGVAFKADNDDEYINNSANTKKRNDQDPDGVSDLWVPLGTDPGGSKKTVVTAEGIFTEDEVDFGNYGINTSFRGFNYWEILTFDNKGGLQNYNNMKKFDNTIDALITASKLIETKENVTSLDSSYDDRVKVIKWEGTLTAKDTGDYTLIGHKVDNGFAMFVNDKKVYEFWGAEHWLEGGNLKSDLGSFHVDAGESYNVEMYFLGLGGGQKSLEMYATTTPDNIDSGKNINEAFTLSLTQEHYLDYARNYISELIPDGVAGEGTNHGQCVEENFKYDETIDKFLEISTETDKKVVQTISEAVVGGDFYLVTMDGYLTPKTTGEYTFGAFNVDNCFYMEINGTPVYEFWANGIYNANVEGNTYTKSIKLEAGKTYKFEAAFLEITGGEVIDLNAKIGDADAKHVNELFTFTTSHEHEWSDVNVTKAPTCGKAGEGTQTCSICGEEKKVSVPATGKHTYVDGVCSVCGAKENEPPKTGDAAAFISAVAIASLLGAAVVVSKKRTYNR